MTWPYLTTQLLALLAGLVLFLTGMATMRSGLQQAAGKKLRQILQKATARRLPGLGLGTILGAFIQSSAGSVMLIGFIGAGLISFAGSVPVILGINIGTSLSMLMISFRLGDACWLAITTGVLLRIAWPKAQPAGTALLGFGLIFLGLTVMSDAIHPFRASLAPILQLADGTQWRGMLIGVGASILFTGIIQSSGATIGMVFAMLNAGAMTSFAQAYPIIIGASVGTCVTALIGAARSSTEARCCAVTHLLFNLFATALAIVTAPLMYRFIPLTTALAHPVEGPFPPHILVSQCANANLIKMTVSALLVVPFAPLVARVVTRWYPTPEPPSETSLLDPALTHTPEDALQAAIHEIHRIIELCMQRMDGLRSLLLVRDTSTMLRMQTTEQAVITIQESMHRYLHSLTRQTLTKRQSLLTTQLYNGIDHCERIAEHIAVLAPLLVYRHRTRHAELPPEVIDHLLRMNQRATESLQCLANVFTPSADDREARIHNVLQARDAFMDLVYTERDDIATSLANETCPLPAAIFRTRFLTEQSRIVKHVRALAFQAQTPYFRIKTKRLAHPASL